VLSLVDGTILITAFSAAVFISMYILENYRASGRSSLIKYLYYAPLGVRVALPILSVRVGAVLLVGALLSSRFRDQKINSLEITIVLLGIILLVVGLIWMTRVLTKHIYGEWPWVTTTLITISYIMIMLVWHFH
jgi:hypothetical protein